MINFSKLNHKSIIGKSIRFPLKFIPKNTVIKIIQGPNKGFKWIKASGTNGYWLGSYELPKQKKIKELCKKAMTCWDIGAHVGFYSLLMSRLISNSGKVIAFEPDGRNIYWFQKHLDLNRIKNIDIVHAALSDSNTLEFFQFGNNTEIGRITKSPTQNIVATFSGDYLIENKIVPVPDIIKIDVEGAELEVLKGLWKTMDKYNPVIFVVIDDIDRKEQTLDFLKHKGYKCEAIENMLNEFVCKK